jgi:hypothetical protein
MIHPVAEVGSGNPTAWAPFTDLEKPQDFSHVDRVAGLAYLDSTLERDYDYDDVIDLGRQIVAGCDGDRLLVWTRPYRAAWEPALDLRAVRGALVEQGGIRGRPALIQSDYGLHTGFFPRHHGHFELLVPLQRGGIRMYWRRNDDGDPTNPPAGHWEKGGDFGDGFYDEVGLIQSDYKHHGDNGTLEVVAWQRGQRGFDFYWRGDQHDGWAGPVTVGLPSKARSVRTGGGLLQRRPWPERNLEAVIPHRDLIYLSRPAFGSRWFRDRVPIPMECTWAALTQSDFANPPDCYGIGPSGNLEVLAAVKSPTGTSLMHAFLRGTNWRGLRYVTINGKKIDDVIGPFHLIQDSGRPGGDFHAVVPLRRGLAHLVRNNAVAGLPWRIHAMLPLPTAPTIGPTISDVGTRNYTATAAALIQSDYWNLEVIANCDPPGGGGVAVTGRQCQLVHYTFNGKVWTGPFEVDDDDDGDPVVPMRGGIPALVQDATRLHGDFHLLIPLRDGLAHYIRYMTKPGYPWRMQGGYLPLPQIFEGATPAMTAAGEGNWRPAHVLSLAMTQSDLGPRDANLEVLAKLEGPGWGRAGLALSDPTYIVHFSFDGTSWSGPVDIGIDL